MGIESDRWNRKILAIRNYRMRRSIKEKDFTIIANNCIAGTIYQDLGIAYQTPFVGLYVMPTDFVKICSNLEVYLGLVVEQDFSSEFEFPVGILGDVKIYFMHYQSFDDAVSAWNRRKTRINFNNLMFILVERDGCTSEDLLNFDCLSFPNKVILCVKRYGFIKNSFVLNFYHEQSEVGNVLEFKNKFSGKRVMYDFNFTKWLKNLNSPLKFL